MNNCLGIYFHGQSAGVVLLVGNGVGFGRVCAANPCGEEERPLVT